MAVWARQVRPGIKRAMERKGWIKVGEVRMGSAELGPVMVLGWAGVGGWGRVGSGWWLG